MKLSRVLFVVLIFALSVGTAACGGGGSGSSAAQRAAKGNADLQSRIYAQQNNIEFNNYNDRQKIADDPTTILWCTAYPANPNARPVTVPIVGKLTSSEKRPYATSQVVDFSGIDSNSYSPERPGPDKMFGASVAYRYGFTPAHVYVDFTGIETVCTTQPTVYQAQQTDIMIKTDPGLAAAAQQAQAQLKAGVQPGTGGKISQSAGNAAQQTLENATGK